MELESKETSLAPVGDSGGIGGYAITLKQCDGSIVAKEAHKYLNDSLLINELTERVYQLLLNDMQNERERVNNYGMERWL